MLSTEAWSQNYPVTCTPIVKPSYSLKWSEISTSNDMFKVHLLLKDLTKISVDVYLKIRLSGVGVDIRTVDGFIPSQTLTLIPGQPRMLTASDLAEYFNISNLVVDGVDISALYNGGRLPEGLYTWTVEAYEIDRNRQVSNTGMALMNVFKNYPPIINIPQDGAIMPVTTPQNVLFSWTSRSTASLNAAQGRKYTLRIYDITDVVDFDPNADVASGIAPYQDKVTYNKPFYPYGASDAALIKGHKYAVQVQEEDENKIDEYENEGKSQVVTFSYGKPCIAPEGMVINPIGKGRVELTCEATAEDAETYPITAWYKTPKTLIWNSVPFNGNSAVISGLKDKTDYEFKLSSACGDNTNTMSSLRAGDLSPSGDPSTEPEIFKIDDSEFDEEEPEVLDPAILDPYGIGIEINADGTTRPVETVNEVLTKIIKPVCVNNFDAYESCSPNHPAAQIPTGTIPLASLAIGDVLGIYDYAVLVTQVSGGTALAGKGLVKLPFLDNAFMAVEFEGIKAWKTDDPNAKGGCVYDVPENGFHTRPINQKDLEDEKVDAVSKIIKLTDPTVFHGNLDKAVKEYVRLTTPPTTTPTTQQRQDLGVIAKGISVATSNWKDKFTEAFSAGGVPHDSNPKIKEIMDEMDGIINQLNIDIPNIKNGPSFPSIPNLKAKIDAIIEKIKALQQENTPKPPRIQNVLATNIGYNEATLTWQGDPRFTKYVISYKTADGGELIETVSGNRLDIKKLQENSQYGFKIEGYVGDEVVDTYEESFVTLMNKLPMPENIKSVQIDKNTLQLTWDKNKLHENYELTYTDRNGVKRFIPIDKSNTVTLTELNPEQVYDFNLIAFNKTARSDAAMGTLSTLANCPDFKIEAKIIYNSIKHDGSTLILSTVGCESKSDIVWYSNRISGILAIGETMEVITTSSYEEIITAVCKKDNCKSTGFNIFSHKYCYEFYIKSYKDKIIKGQKTSITSYGCNNGITQWNTGETGNTIYVTPQQSTEYTAKCVLDNDGKCLEALQKIEVIDFNCSGFKIITDKTIVAKGESVNLSTTECLGEVVWNTGDKGNLKIYPDRTTEYSATCITDAGNCPSIPLTINLQSNSTSPLPKERCIEFKVFAEKDIILSGTSTNLFAVGCPNEVSWGTFGIGNGISVTPDKTTTYTAKCIGSDCEFQITINVTTNLCQGFNVTGFDKNYEQYGKGVYPYPNSFSKLDVKVVGCNGDIQWGNVTYGHTLGFYEYSSNPKGFPDFHKPNYTGTYPYHTQTYRISCSVPSCEIYKTVNINDYRDFKLIASPNIVQSGEPSTLSTTGCNGTIKWINPPLIIVTHPSNTTDVFPTETTTYKALCIERYDNWNSLREVTVFVKTNTDNCTFKITPDRQILSEVNYSTKITATACDGGIINWNNNLGNGVELQVSPTNTTTYVAKCSSTGCEAKATIGFLSCSNFKVSKKSDIEISAEGCPGIVTWDNSLGEGSVKKVYETKEYIATCTTTGCKASFFFTPRLQWTDCKKFSIVANPASVPKNVSTTVTITSTGCEAGTVKWNNKAEGQSITVNLKINNEVSYSATCFISGVAQTDATTTIKVRSGAGSGADDDPCKAFVANVVPIGTNYQTEYKNGTEFKFTSSGCQGVLNWYVNNTLINGSKHKPSQTTNYYTALCKIGSESCYKYFTVNLKVDCAKLEELAKTYDAYYYSQCKPFATTEIAYDPENREILSCPGKVTWYKGLGTEKILLGSIIGNQTLPLNGYSEFYTSECVCDNKILTGTWHAIRNDDPNCGESYKNARTSTESQANNITAAATTDNNNSSTSNCLPKPLQSVMEDYFKNLICSNWDKLIGDDKKVSAQKVNAFLEIMKQAILADPVLKKYNPVFPANSVIIDALQQNNNCTEAGNLLSKSFNGNVSVDEYNNVIKETYNDIQQKINQALKKRKLFINPLGNTFVFDNTLVGEYICPEKTDLAQYPANGYTWGFKINGKQYVWNNTNKNYQLVGSNNNLLDYKLVTDLQTTDVVYYRTYTPRTSDCNSPYVTSYILSLADYQNENLNDGNRNQSSNCGCSDIICGTQAIKGPLAEQFYNKYKANLADQTVELNCKLIKLANLVEDIGTEYYNDFVEQWQAETSYLNYWFLVPTKPADKFTADELGSAENELKDYYNALKRLQGTEKGKANIIELINTHFVSNTTKYKILFRTAFKYLTAERRIEILKYMAEGNIAGQWSISSLQNAEEIIVALLETAPNDQAQTILTGLKDEKLLFPFFKNVDGENFNKLITRLTDFVLASYSRPRPFDLQAAIANNRYIHFNDNWLGTINKEQILSTGQFYVSTQKFITGSNALYSIIASPYEYILTTFENNFGVGDDKFLKGESYVLPAMYVYLLFNQDTKQAYKTSGKIALMTGLTLLGIGEIAAAIETGSVTGFVVGSIDVGLGVGDIALNEVFKNEIIDKYGDEGKDFIETWQKISMVWGVGRIASTSLNKKLTPLVNNVRSKIRLWKQQVTYNSVSSQTRTFLNKIDNEVNGSNFDEFLDEIPYANIINNLKTMVAAKLPQSLKTAFKNLGKTDDQILEYFARYHYETNFFNEIDNLLQKYPNLTPEDAYVLWGYTTNFFYRDMNAWLRQGINADKTQEIANILNTALNKMPKYGGSVVYRGIEIAPANLNNFLTNYAKGKEVTFGDFTSCGGNKEASFASRPEINVMFEIEHLNGKDITDFADGIKYRGMPAPEILIPSGVKFEVTAPYKIDPNSGKIVIKLRQKP